MSDNSAPGGKQTSSWIETPAHSDFPIQNIPFGIASAKDRAAHPCTRIGDTVVDLGALAKAGLLSDLGIAPEAFQTTSLNALMRHGKPAMRKLRQRLGELLSADNGTLRNDAATRTAALLPVADCTLHLPIEVGDYTDFYSSREHAFNVGTMFRGPENALMPNWLHLPVGYHGRASSIVASGTPLHRPKGQMRPKPDEPPVFGASKQMDFELETGFITFGGKPLGQHISVEEAEEHIFGMVLFNDWSARDIQSWEYVPLGPFLGKNFGSSMGAWVVTLDALEPFRTAQPEPEFQPLPYLQGHGKQAFDIALETVLTTPEGSETVISRSNFKHLYWSMAQQLAHHTVNGCNIRCGDLLASGTISAPDPSGYGSMLELSWRGTKPITLADGSERKFINDGDTITMRGHCEKDGLRIGFGEVKGTILPAL
ncbi:MAG: fumarylacetoacetase [Flavobacteriales bacterium]|nr:fumarylacetoacetase [Flavobacteriales bacterium]